MLNFTHEKKVNQKNKNANFPTFSHQTNRSNTKRERERERERDKCLEAKKMKENENPETLKRLRVFFF